MPVFVAGRIGERLCEALGLDADKVINIDLEFPATGVATAIVTFQPTAAEVDELLSVIELFELHPVD